MERDLKTELNDAIKKSDLITFFRLLDLCYDHLTFDDFTLIKQNYIKAIEEEDQPEILQIIIDNNNGILWSEELLPLLFKKHERRQVSYIDIVLFIEKHDVDEKFIRDNASPGFCKVFFDE